MKNERKERERKKKEMELRNVSCVYINAHDNKHSS